MDSEQPDAGYEPGQHRRQTEGRLVLGGFALLLLVGGGLLWLLYGRTLALTALGVVLIAILLLALLWGLLRAIEAWAKSG